MRIVDASNNQYQSITLILTPGELKELVDKLKRISPDKGDHIHVNDENFEYELVVAIDTPENHDFFSDEIKRILE